MTVCAGPRYSRIVIRPRQKAKWQNIAKDAGHPYRELALMLLGVHAEVYSLTEQWTRAVMANRAKQISVFSLLKPTLVDGFSGTPVIMSACVKDTLLYRIWSQHYRVDWQKHRGISGRVRYDRHTNGDLLTIYYASERDYSKTLRDRALACGVSTTFLEAFVAAIIALFGDDPYAYMCNRDIQDPVEDTAHQLPNSPHGLNQYQHLHNCAVFSALNLMPAHIAFLQEWVGIDPDQIRKAVFYQATYQAVMRISLRNPDDRHQKRIVVPDEGCAQYIAALFPGCKITRLPSAIRINKPKGRGRNVSRQKVLRDYAREKKMKLGMGMTLASGAFEMSIFEHKKAAKPVAVVQWSGVDAFVAELRARSQIVIPKDQNQLISPSVFDPQLAIDADERNADGKHKLRGRVNVIAAVGIWLDNDHGMMSRQEFANLFSDLRMVIYSSYHSEPGAERYRVYIPTSHTMSADLYLFITHQIKTKVEQHGRGMRSERWLLQWEKAFERENGRKPRATEIKWDNHGFDWSKTMPENLMYLPARTKHPDGNFFDDLSEGRALLDVLAWIEHPIDVDMPADDQEAMPELYAPVSIETILPPITDNMKPARRKFLEALWKQEGIKQQQRRQQMVAKAIADWRTIPPSHGHHGFYALARHLYGAGLDLAMVQRHLDEEAMTSRSPADRNLEIKSIIDGLRRKKAA